MDFCPSEELSLVPRNLFLFLQNCFSLTLLNTVLPGFYPFRTQLQKITYLAVSLVEVLFFFTCLQIKNKVCMFVLRVLPILPSIVHVAHLSVSLTQGLLLPVFIIFLLHFQKDISYHIFSQA